MDKEFIRFVLKVLVICSIYFSLSLIIDNKSVIISAQAQEIIVSNVGEPNTIHIDSISIPFQTTKYFRSKPYQILLGNEFQISRKRVSEIARFSMSDQFPTIIVESSSAPPREYVWIDLNHEVNDENILQVSQMLEDTLQKLGISSNEYRIINIRGISRLKSLPERIKTSGLKQITGSHVNISHLGIEDRLKDDVVLSLCEDNIRGGMWLGTKEEGLCWFDGTNLMHYTFKEGLINNYIKSLLLDREGNLWIGTAYGINKFDGFNFSDYLSNGIAGEVASIMEARNGKLWFGTANGLFCKNGIIWNQFTVDQGLTCNQVECVIEDRDSIIWVGTKNGLCLFMDNSFVPVEELNGYEINDLCKGTDGTIWIATNNGVLFYKDSILSRLELPFDWNEHAIESLCEDQFGSLWFGIWGKGIVKYSNDYYSQYSTNEGIPIVGISSVMEDRAGNIWLSTHGSGIFKLSESPFTFYPNPGEKDHNVISSIAFDPDEDLWIGMPGEGPIKCYNDTLTFYNKTAPLDKYNVRCIFPDNQGNIWYGGATQELQNVNELSLTSYHFPEQKLISYVNSVVGDNNGNLWIGTMNDGLKLLADNYSKLYEIKGVGPVIRCLIKDIDDNIWCGTSGSGLYQIKEGAVYRYRSRFNFEIDGIATLYCDKSGNIWIGTADCGLFKMADHTFINYTVKDGLSNNSIRSIIEDKSGNLWVGTKNGLNLLRIVNDSVSSIVSFDREDGLNRLTFNENAVSMDSKGRIWWGTGAALTIYNGGLIESNLVQPKLKLNGISINQKVLDFLDNVDSKGVYYRKPVKAEKGTHNEIKFSGISPFSFVPLDLELPYNLNRLSFEFSAITWDNPEEIEYQFMLDGIEETWGPKVKNGIIEYNNLPPGKFVMKARASPNGDIWSNAYEYGFTIRKPWWYQLWAIGVYCLIALLLLSLIIRFFVFRERRISSIKLNEAELKRVRDLQQMRSHFFQNISHEFRTPLQLILAPLNDLKKGKSKLQEREKKLLSIIDRNTSRIAYLTDQLFDLSRIENGSLKLNIVCGDLSGFVKAIVLSFISLADGKGIDYKYDIQDISGQKYFDEDKIEKIVSNLISNAIKYTKNGGKVKVALHYEGLEKNQGKDQVILTVEDTGEGIPEDLQEKVFDRFYQIKDTYTGDLTGMGIGLSLTKELVELYSGTIELKSHINIGSNFTISLPYLLKDFEKERIVLAKNLQKSNLKVSLNSEVEDVENDYSQDLSENGEHHKILIVEDNRELRNYISSHLEEQAKVFTAENGKDGLDIALEEIPDIIITDIMMPGLDGIKLCAALKSHDNTNHIPVIIVTAKTDRESRIRGLKYGAEDYITKPFDIEELKLKIQNQLENNLRRKERFQFEFLIGEEERRQPVYNDRIISNTIKCYNDNLGNSEFNAASVSKVLNLSKSQFYRKIGALTGHSPNELLIQMRLNKAAYLFEKGNDRVTEVMHQVGFNNPSYFAKIFKNKFSSTPSKYIHKKNINGDRYPIP